jgi:hypothetical protein
MEHAHNPPIRLAHSRARWLPRPRMWTPLAVLLAGALATAVFADPASAAQPTKTSFTISGSFVPTDICSFPVTFDIIQRIDELTFFDQGGAVTRVQDHVVEQDTLRANGNTLPGLPITYNVRVLFDSSGNVTDVFTEGAIEVIPLPDGTVFHSAGRVVVFDHPGVDFFIEPDHGAKGDVAALCAALS